MTLLPQGALILLAALPSEGAPIAPAERATSEMLAPGWEELKSGDDTYYYNEATGETSWDFPAAPAAGLAPAFRTPQPHQNCFDNTHPPPQDRCRRDGRSSTTRRTGCRTISMRAQEKRSGSALPPMRPPPHRPCLPQCRLQRRQARNRRRPITVLHRRRRPTAPVLDLARLRCIVRRCMPTALFPSRPRRRIIKSVSSACRRLRARTSR